jgi:hypothetical protein
MTALVIVALTFVGLTIITFPIQQANAYTAPLCGLATGTGAEPVTATTVSYGGKKFDIIGYNKNGTEVGVAGPNNSVTLLLDKSTIYITGPWNPVAINNTYTDSSISKAMNTFANSVLTTNAGIVERTLAGGSDTYGALSGYNEDLVVGSNVTNQKVWPLSVDEASHLILSTRVFPDNWWLRTPGAGEYYASKVNFQGTVLLVGEDVYSDSDAFRPALYLGINSPALSSVIASEAWQSNSIPIGACAPQPNDLGIDYSAETVTGLDNDTQGWSLADSYAGLTTPTQTAATPINISSNIGATASTLYYVKATTNTDLYFNSNSDSNGVAKLNAVEGFSKLTIPARPAGPSGLNGIAPSDVGASDGKITGTSNKMEYSTDEVSWTAVGGSAITGLTSGTYFVRTIADQSTSKFKSFAIEVVVKEGSTGPGSGPSAGKPGSGTGPSAGNGGFSSEGTAQTGVDFAGLGLLLLLLLACSVIASDSVAISGCVISSCHSHEGRNSVAVKF